MTQTNIISVAPMLDWTNRHYRYLVRLISRHVFLYTEMVPLGGIVHGERGRFLGFDPVEHPLALQIGGADPDKMAIAAEYAQQAGFDEININAGCPSDRVHAGSFGACLFKTPEVVANCVKAMQEKSEVLITVKTRLGVDDFDSDLDLNRFIETVHAAGCHTFILHARMAYLQKYSPKENRTIPPLVYEAVYRLKQDYPDIEIVINGGITSIEQVAEHLQHVDGVMIGREAYTNPWILADADDLIASRLGTACQINDDQITCRVGSAHQNTGCKNESGGQSPPYKAKHTREEVVTQYLDYVLQQSQQGISLSLLLRPLLGIYHGQPGGRLWRRMIGDILVSQKNGRSPMSSVNELRASLHK